MTDTTEAPGVIIPSVPCASIFAAIEGYAAPHMVPADQAQPGDFLGLVLDLAISSDKHAGYNSPGTVRRFIMQGEGGPDIVRFRDLPEDKKDLAARISMEAHVFGWNHEPDLMEAVDEIEDEENGLCADIYLLPGLGLMISDNWDNWIEDLDPDAPEEFLSEHFCALRRPAVSNHEAIDRQAIEAPALAVMNALMVIPSNPEEDDAPMLRIALPQQHDGQ